MTSDQREKIKREIKKILSDKITKTPLDLVNKVRESNFFPIGIPAQYVIQVMWQLHNRGELSIHTKHGIILL